jgi:hypothetical protein
MARAFTAKKDPGKADGFKALNKAGICVPADRLEAAVAGRDNLILAPMGSASALNAALIYRRKIRCGGLRKGPALWRTPISYPRVEHIAQAKANIVVLQFLQGSCICVQFMSEN